MYRAILCCQALLAAMDADSDSDSGDGEVDLGTARAVLKQETYLTT